MKPVMSKQRKYLFRILAVVVWLLLWQLCSRLITYKFLFASPLEMLSALFRLSVTSAFWKTVMYSLGRIALGFVLALLSGIAAAACAYRFTVFEIMIEPLVKLVKAIPVASFVILALLWVNSSNLSILISFLMVFPVIYTNCLQGIKSTDSKLLEMAQVFRISALKKIRYIYIPALIPQLVSACSIGLGFCWKSGVAAEVIGHPANSIGLRLYDAKLNIMTDELFAWTFVIVILSMLFEKFVMLIIKALQKKLM